VAIAFAYVVGQLTSIISTVILEQWLVNRVFSLPFAILTGTAPARTREQLIARWAAAPYLRPLSEHMRRKTKQRAFADLTATGDITSSEQIFQPAHAAARKNVDTREWLDESAKPLCT
jgi:hypothetical protein